MSNAVRIDRIDTNMVVNGGFDFTQRGSSFTVTATQVYTLDRWVCNHVNNATSSTVSRVLDSPTAASSYCLQFAANSSTTTHQKFMTHRIESYNCGAAVAAGAISVSFWYKNQNAQSLILTVLTAGSQDNWTTNTTVYTSSTITTNTSFTWTQLTFNNIAIPGSGANGIAIQIEMTNMATTGSNRNDQIAQVMVIPGITTPSFVRSAKHIGSEFLLCQRYYEVCEINAGNTNGSNVALIATSGTHVEGTIRYNVAKRAAPTLTSNITNIFGPSVNTTATAFFNGITVNSARMYTDFGVSSFTTGDTYMFTASATVGQVYADAELY
jgi:hypothetical protein